MDKRTALSSPRILEIKKRKRRVLRNRAIFFSVIFVFVFIGLVFFSRWKEVNIVNIEISGNKIVETNLIKNAVEEELAGRYLWLFPKSNSFIYPRSRLQYELNNKFKRLKDIKLEVKELKTLSISVTELEGKYTWCGESLNDGVDIDTEVLEDSCYFIDKTGYIFDNAPYFSGSVYFKFFGKISNIENGPIGRYFAPE